MFFFLHFFPFFCFKIIFCMLLGERGLGLTAVVGIWGEARGKEEENEWEEKGKENACSNLEEYRGIIRFKPRLRFIISWSSNA